MRYVKALALPFAVLSLMALFAATATAAETHGDFKLKNSSGVSILLQETETISGELEDPNSTSLLVPNLNFAIRCHTLDVTSGTILPLNASKVSIGHGKLLFLGCLAYTHKTLELLTKCTVGNGTIHADVLILVVRDKSLGKAYLLVEPTGKVFTTVEFGPLCGALAEETIEITGELIGETLALEAVKQLIEEAPHEIQLLFGAKLMFGTNQAFLDGEVAVFQTGKHAGREFGIEAGH